MFLVNIAEQSREHIFCVLVVRICRARVGVHALVLWALVQNSICICMYVHGVIAIERQR